MKLAWFLAAAFFSQVALADVESDFYEQYYSKNFRGWKGIVFICTYSPSDKVLAKICSRASTDLELLTASHDIELEIIQPNEHGVAAFQAASRGFLTLEYDLTATKPTNSSNAKAIHGQITYALFYSNAVEKDAESGSIDRLPRSGDLEIWSDSIIGSGLPSRIVKPFGDGAETHLKKAVSLFLKYTK